MNPKCVDIMGAANKNKNVELYFRALIFQVSWFNFDCTYCTDNIQKAGNAAIPLKLYVKTNRRILLS